MVIYALHDAMLKPMPGNPVAPGLAESWSMSPDGLVYEFVLRKGVKFHNGDPVTAEDVKFSFERYKGGGAPLFRERVKEVQVIDPGRVRFILHEPWPDFMTFYGTSASGAAWVVPKKYFEKVGEDGFRRAPVGAGPFKFVSFQPGVELVLEAFDGYWRKKPGVKRLIIRNIPDEATRAAALKRNEVDIVYFITGLKPVEVSLKGLKGKFPNGNDAFMWSHGRVMWENGAMLSVINGLGYPDAAAGSNDQGMVLYCEGNDQTGLIYHDDHNRGVAYSYLEGIGPGGSKYNYASPDFYRLVPWEGRGYKPIGYGYESVAGITLAIHRLESATAGLAAEAALAKRRELIHEVDAQGLIATPANSYINELVVEAARASILADAKPVRIVYGEKPGIVN